MNRILLVILLLSPASVSAQPYLSVGFGPSVTPGLELRTHSEGTGGGSLCDEYINPRYAELQECPTAPGPGSSWRSVFDRAAGVLGNVAFGYRVGGRLRGELEYFHAVSDYDQTVRMLDPSGDLREEVRGDIERARERVYDVSSHNLFANVYVDFAVDRRVTPYLGFGVGIGSTEIDSGRINARALDPAAIGIPDHVPNADEIRQNLAGTASVHHGTDSDRVEAYQVLFGADIDLSDRVALGVQGRWVWFGRFEASGAVDQLRSHPPNHRLDGSWPVTTHQTAEGVRIFSLTVGLKYTFGGI